MALMIERYKLVHINILKALARFKYLRSSHFVDLEIVKRKGDLSRPQCMPQLTQSRKKLVGVAKDGRLQFREHLYFLTRQGKNFLQKTNLLVGSTIHFPVRPSTSLPNDYAHRVRTIDFHIALSKCYPIVFFDRYFDKAPTGSRWKTQLKVKGGSIAPDAIFKIMLNDKEQLYCLEIENGKNVKKAMEHIEQYAWVLHEGTANERYQYFSPIQIIFLFDEKSTLEGVKNRFQELEVVKNMRRHFIFDSQDLISKAESFQKLFQ